MISLVVKSVRIINLQFYEALLFCKPYKQKYCSSTMKTLLFFLSFLFLKLAVCLGSYDHTVRMFDTRTNITSMAVNHGCPVESILVFPSGALLISAGKF